MNNVLSVQELTTIIKGKFQCHLNDNFTVQGEVINLSKKNHYYFSLKDVETKMVIRAILWKGTLDKNNYILENGDIIIARGKISLYDVQNSYSLTVFKMIKEENRETEYQRKYEMFKNKDYFNKHNILDKSEIKSVGLITSTQGQAINDFKKTLSSRFFTGKIYIHNVNVQGVKCAKDVIKAIKFFEKSKKYNVDLILITRGGGSQLDMDEFNNENLIEHIYKSKKIIYVGIGHESDYCLCDYVCDERSSTPTSLAYLISEDYSKINNKLRMVYESDKNNFEKAKSEIMFGLNNNRTKLYQLISNNKPSGFYFGNHFINNIGDFQKLCDETFNIKLEDGVIEFKINKHKVVEKFNKKYTHSKYLEVYNNDFTCKVSLKDNKSYIKYLTKLSKLEKEGKFGKKEHFDLFEKILKMTSFYMRELQELEGVTKAVKKFNHDELKDYEELLQYKKHLNYLEKLLESDCKGIKPIKSKNTNNELCKNYLNYNNKDGISQYLLSLYQTIKRMKCKYYRLKV